jgi:DNA-binding response OmpR family regulator
MTPDDQTSHMSHCLSDTPTRPRVLVVETDPATLQLLREWLCAEGWEVADDGQRESGRDGAYALAVVDIPFPRRGGCETLQSVGSRHPNLPILVLSSTFFATVDCCGAVAHALGVAGVLAKPIRREALVCAVERLSRPPA